jgi:predicted nucleic acid-binding protein
VTYVVDTCLLLDHLRSVEGATAELDRALASGRRVTGSVLTRTELRRGARPHELAAIETVEILLDWVPVDHEIASRAAEHAEEFGAHVDTTRCVIAATAERLDADLLTCDVRDFPMFPDLEPPYEKRA